MKTAVVPISCGKPTAEMANQRKCQKCIDGRQRLPADSGFMTRPETAAGDVQPPELGGSLQDGEAEQEDQGQKMSSASHQPHDQTHAENQLQRREDHDDELPYSGIDQIVRIDRTQKKIGIPPMRNATDNQGRSENPRNRGVDIRKSRLPRGSLCFNRCAGHIVS